MRYDNVAIFKDTMEKCGSVEALKTSIESSIKGQTFFAADSQSKAVEERRFASTKLLLQNKRSFQAAVGLEGRVCVHNFASFTHPGGGVAKGSTAQEECLCRISTLYPCLNSDYALSNFYSRHKGFGSPLYNSDVLYTPGVKVFKTDAAMPMTLPENLWYDVDVVTCAAPNLMKVRISDKELLSLHTERLGRILNAASAAGADSLVLGAFGCGVFKNNPKIVAQASVEVAGMYDGCFDRIVFAIPASNDNSNYWEFERALKLKRERGEEMTRKDDFGDRMKSYEAAYMQHTVPRVPLVIRVDGCHFHLFTRGMAKPFDPILTKTMQDTMLAMCKEITGAVFGYTQSDEITVVCRLADPVNMSEYYEGRVQKILSITASKATLNFNRWFMRNVNEYGLEPDKYPGAADPDVYRRRLMGAEFDSRVMNIPDMDLYNCLIWRQSDATRNSVSMLAQYHYTQRELQGKKRPEMMDMLMLEKGVNWNDLDTVKKRGACCYRKDTGRKRPEWFVDCEMPILSSDEGREMFMPIVLGTAEGAESRFQRCRSRIW